MKNTVNKTTVNAYAKINLYLDVINRRGNGYHDIESVMQSISLHDVLTVEFIHSSNNEIVLTSSDPSLPCNEKNLAFRAARLMADKLELRDYKIKIDIEKHIPVAAGLAGGSADAAAVFTSLNSLLNFPLTTEELCRLGASLGADIPFIIRGGCMTAQGIGDILTPCTSLTDAFILVVRPTESVSTAEAYRKIDETGLCCRKAAVSLENMIKALKKHEISEVSSAAYNVFEEVIPKSSEVFKLKKTLDENGAAFSMMSGSGPAVFGVFTHDEYAIKAADQIKRLGYESEICRPVNVLKSKK